LAFNYFNSHKSRKKRFFIIISMAAGVEKIAKRNINEKKRKS